MTSSDVFFRAVLDLNQRVTNLKVLVALRTNIIEALDFGRAGGQEEKKFRDQSHRVHWTKDELRELLDERVVVAAGRFFGLADVKSMAELLPQKNRTRGDALDYLLNRTLLRPRDAISFLNECFALSGGRERLSWNGINAAELTYSKGRLMALRDEWKPTYPGIDQVFEAFTRVLVSMTWEDMIVCLDECALLSSEERFPGSSWIEEYGEPIWHSSAKSDRCEVYQPFVRLLYSVGFIGCVCSSSENVRGEVVFLVDDPTIYSYDDPYFADHASNLRKVSSFVVHPAFRPALDISRVN